MQTVIRTVLAVALVAACSSNKQDKQQPPPAPVVPEPVVVAPLDAATAVAPSDAAVAPTPDPPPDPDPTPSADPDPRTGANEGPPTNLEVLPKSWDRNKVTKYMKEQVSKGLGVKCKECHDTDDFASDAKEDKGEARAMIKMQNDINKRFFEGKSRVSCMTCHMGSKEPAGE